MNVGEHLVAKLVEEGVDVIFTVPGEQHDAIFGALAGTQIRVVHTRHEQAAALLPHFLGALQRSATRASPV